MNYSIKLNSVSAITMNLVILLEKTVDDYGFYITTDGNISQEKVRCNFTYSFTGNTISVFNSVDVSGLMELNNAIFTINWGDGIENEIGVGETQLHPYSQSGKTVISLSMDVPWGDKVKKTINIGDNQQIFNPLGTLILDVPYSNSTFTQNFINDLDADCQDLDQSGLLISGFTQSRLNELIKYGNSSISEGLDGNGNGVLLSGITVNYTAYTIDDIFYTDFEDGLTYYHLNVGDNPLDLICELIIKDESTIGVVSDIQIQSDIFIERGKISVFERNLRLSDVKSTGEISLYGNGYFKVNKTV